MGISGRHMKHAGRCLRETVDVGPADVQALAFELAQGLLRHRRLPDVSRTEDAHVFGIGNRRRREYQRDIADLPIRCWRACGANSGRRAQASVLV